MSGIDPIVLDIGLEIIKAILGVAVPAMTIALTFYARKINHNLKMKTLKDEIEKLVDIGEETQFFRLMDKKEQQELLLDSMKTFVIGNEINISESQLILLIDRAMNSKQNLKMRFQLLSMKGKQHE